MNYEEQQTVQNANLSIAPRFSNPVIANPAPPPEYEIQTKSFGSWSAKLLGSHPAYSDVTGKLRIPRDKIQPPVGWAWNGDWNLVPQQSQVYTDFICDQFFNILVRFYCKNRRSLFLRDRFRIDNMNTSASGEKCPSKEEMVCPQGWHYVEEWRVVHNKATDHQGWKYSIDPLASGTPKSWSAAEKAFHTNRHRQWQRIRQRDQPSVTIAEPDTWEYGSGIELKFHLTQKSTDTFRRRCWRRTMIPQEELGVLSIFLLEGSMELDIDKKKSSKSNRTKNEFKGVLRQNTPLIYCLCQGPIYYQLRCYIFQARHLFSDSSKSPDLYIQVAFLHVSQRTEIQPCTLTPFWDQTLVFSGIQLYDDQQSVVRETPYITIELLDNSHIVTGNQGKGKFLGWNLCYPVVCLDVSTRVPPSLEWHKLRKGRRSCGEVLAAFELLLDETDGKLDSIATPSCKDNGNLMVPNEVRPVLMLMMLEILAWGLRALKYVPLLNMHSPSLLIECGGQSVQTSPIHDITKNPNFPHPFLRMILARNEGHLKIIILKIFDNRPFGYTKETILCLLQEFCPYLTTLVVVSAENMSESKVSEVTESQASKQQTDLQELNIFGVERTLRRRRSENEYDWWSKYEVINRVFCDENVLNQIYDTELESIPEFHGLQDFCQTFQLCHGRSVGETIENDNLQVVGEVKASFRIYPLPENTELLMPPAQFYDIPDNSPQECLLRIYIVRGLDLSPRDRNGLCDPYVQISVGKRKMDNRENYIPCTLNPVFGKLFELNCIIPLEKDLKVCVFDYDIMSDDDKIGETYIDLENRLLSRFGAKCGLPQTYSV
ncbi:myoferlin isoform X2 [Pelobates cultripes]|uniref:Myoferlin isoform X2 n=1 Tax=Pelobates cultripes TaxID=61616 RepID=A0AAD1RN83_PELCU|nr:myoferlin isoform X2 [Pelobates cultripes]